MGQETQSDSAAALKETATAAAKALYDKFRAGTDAEGDTRSFLQLGSSIPDALVLAAVGTRESKPCIKSLKALLEGRANPNAVDQQTTGTVLHTACWMSTPEVVRTLIEYRADIEKKEPRMHTPPLNTALAAGNAKVCLELLNRNADVLWQHHDGATPLHVASYWIAASHNSQLRMPPVGEEPIAVIQMMLHNGVDPTQTEGMTKSTTRGTGMTPLESFRRQVTESPWRQHEVVGKKFDETVKKIYVLLEKGEEAIKYKNAGNTAFKEKRFKDAIEQYTRAMNIWKGADIRGHHSAVLWSNMATCHRKEEEWAEMKKACEEGLAHFASGKIRKKLEDSLKEAEVELAKTPEEVSAEKAARPAPAPRPPPSKLKESFIETSEKPIYPEEGSAQGKVDKPGPFICNFEDAKEAGMVDGVDGWRDAEKKRLQKLDESLAKDGLLDPELVDKREELDLINRQWEESDED